jgi:hypothetical protein
MRSKSVQRRAGKRPDFFSFFKKDERAAQECFRKSVPTIEQVVYVWLCTDSFSAACSLFFGVDNDDETR